MSDLNNQTNNKPLSCLTIDVEDWFHILDSPAAPDFERWSHLESRIESNLEKLLELLEANSTKATFFWLGWLAERNRNLVLKCQKAGHEIASHGYAHILAYETSPMEFKQDITRARMLLEDIIGEPVKGFRAPGFGITKSTSKIFDIIHESGYLYDSSVFPSIRAHGGISDSPLGPYFIKTQTGHLLEIPMSAVKIFGYRATLFGGGYLRLSSKSLIKWGIKKLYKAELPLIIYIHPREIDPDQPRLPLTYFRRFKCYVNLHSTLSKLQWLCKDYSSITILEMIDLHIKQLSLEERIIPVIKIQDNKIIRELSGNSEQLLNNKNQDKIKTDLLLVEKAMAGFLKEKTDS